MSTPGVLSISMSMATTPSTYVNAGFIDTRWSLVPGKFPVLLKDGYVVIPPTSFVPKITYEESVMRSTYENTGFKFGLVWAIREGLEYPLLLMVGTDTDLGDPGTSAKWYVFVEPSDMGSMYYDNEMYRTLRKSVKVNMYEGEVGEEIIHDWGGQNVPDLHGKMYTFLASGIEDHEFPGGYGHYTDETIRTVVLRDDRSSNVNFYYVEPDVPDYSFLMRVSVPSHIAHIAVMKADVSDIRVKMHDGSICTVALVDVNAEDASPIRVMTHDGIFALKEVDVLTW